MSKPRAPDGTTLRERVYRALRDHSSMDADSLARHLGITTNAAKCTCRDLIGLRKVMKRHVRMTREVLPGWWVTRPWVIYSIVPGTYAPKDRRGKPRGSRNQVYANVVAMNRARWGKYWRPRPRGSALDECWPLPVGKTLTAPEDDR